MKNEKTSKKVAAIAGKVLKALSELESDVTRYVACGQLQLCTAKELKALAASALTQAPDRPKPLVQPVKVEPVKPEKVKAVKKVGKRAGSTRHKGE